MWDLLGVNDTDPMTGQIERGEVRLHLAEAMLHETTPIYDAVTADLRRDPVAGDVVECAGCGRLIRAGHGGAPVRHKVRKGGAWCPGVAR